MGHIQNNIHFEPDEEVDVREYLNAEQQVSFVTVYSGACENQCTLFFKTLHDLHSWASRIIEGAEELMIEKGQMS